MEEGEAYTHTLLYPVVIKDKDGKEIKRVTEITLRGRLKGRHLRAIDGAAGDGSRALALIGALSGELPMVLDELDNDDIIILGELLGGGPPPGQKTGPTSSET